VDYLGIGSGTKQALVGTKFEPQKFTWISHRENCRRKTTGTLGTFVFATLRQPRRGQVCIHRWERSGALSRVRSTSSFI